MILLLGWFTQSCGNFLDMDIPDVLTDDEFWKNRSQVESARNGVYTQLGNCIFNFMIWGDVRSDLYEAPNTSQTMAVQMTFQDILTTNSYASWANVYATINYANSFIKNAERVLEFDHTMKEEVPQMLGEMYGIRALCYFYLVRAFQDVPLHMEPYESDTQEVDVPASSEEQVLDTIEHDLQTAMSLAAEEYPGADNYGRITKKAVKAIWADVKLWRGDYSGCITLCEELEKEYTGKRVYGPNWFTMFSNGNSVESIFEYQYSNEGIKSPLATFAVANNINNLGQGQFEGNNKAYKRNMQKMYAGTGGRDYSDTVRTQGTTYCYNNGTTFDVYKYIGIAPGYEEYSFRDAQTKNNAHFIFYRFREILLIKAEALGMLERYDEAVEPINEIRRTTGLDEITAARLGSGENFFDKLLAERCAELAYEGKQWFSMVRMARHTGYHSLVIDRVADTHIRLSPLVVKSRLQDPESWFMPYFDQEVDRNHALEQKDYYKGKQ